MALDTDPLDEAARAAREEGADWPAVAERIKERVRAVRLPSRPIATYAASGSPLVEDGDPVTVPSREVVGALRTALEGPDHVADSIDLGVEQGRLTSVAVDVVVRYGAPMRPVLDALWSRVVETLREQVGPDPAFDAGSAVAVRAVDVVDGDPRLT